MGRPELPIDPQLSPVSEFAHDLRVLRERAGQPAYWKMARRCGVSKSSLAAAASGRTLPTWPVVAAFVTACGPANLETWRERWTYAQAQFQVLNRTGPEASPPLAYRVIIGELVSEARTPIPRPLTWDDDLPSGRGGNDIAVPVVGLRLNRRSGSPRASTIRRGLVVVTIGVLLGAAGLDYGLHVGRPTKARSGDQAVRASGAAPARASAQKVGPSPSDTNALRSIVLPAGVPARVTCGTPSNRLACQGRNPFTTGCARDSAVAVTASLTPVQIVVFFSPRCQAAWATLTAPHGYQTRIELDSAPGFHTCYPSDCQATGSIDATDCGFLPGPIPCMWTDMAHLSNTVGAEATAIGSWRDPAGRSGRRFVSLTGDDVPAS